MNVDEAGLRNYIEALHDATASLSARYLLPAEAKRVLHNSLLPSQITCYLSTQFGVAFEYSRAAHTTIKVVRGSARVEDLVLRAPKGLRLAFNITGPDCAFINIQLEGGFPFRLTNEGADLRLEEARFSSQEFSWKREIYYAEVYGDRRSERWTIDSAQSKAKDEVLAALFLARQATRQAINLEDYVRLFREKNVLLLGSYTEPGMTRLRALAKGLSEIGYDPLLVADIPDFEHYDQTQKFVAIASVSRFIVIDDSEPSGHLNEIEFCRMNRWVTVLLRAHGRHASSMTLGASVASTVIHERDYNPEDPLPALRAAVAWAEGCLEKLQRKFNEAYPYRMKGPNK